MFLFYCCRMSVKIGMVVIILNLRYISTVIAMDEAIPDDYAAHPQQF